MLVHELMRTHLVSLSEEATYAEAVDILDLYQLPWVPITDGSRKLIGLFEDTAVLSRASIPADELSVISRRPIREFMSMLPVVNPDTDAVSFELQDSNSPRWIPVVDSDNRLVGMLDRVVVVQARLDAQDQQ